MKNISASHDAQAAGRDIVNDHSQVINISVVQPDEDPQFTEQSQWIARLMQLNEAKRLEAIGYSRSVYGTGKFKRLRKDQLFDVVKKFAERKSFRCEFCTSTKEQIAEKESKIAALRKKLLSAYAVILAVSAGLIFVFAFK